MTTQIISIPDQENSCELAPGTAALVMPLALAERVAEPGPTIRHPGEVPWCVLLVQAAQDEDQRQVAELANRKVGYLGAGNRVDLPPTRFSDEGPLTWHRAPATGQDWPQFSMIARALLDS